MLSTVTTTWSVAVQPVEVLVTVNVYVVVALGFAVGLDTVEELKPVVGLHE
jgi:hypothetical protein